MAKLTVNLKNTSGNDFAGQSVVIELLNEDNKNFLGVFEDDETSTIINDSTPRLTDENGLLVVDLIPNEKITNEKSHYTITITGITKKFKMPNEDKDLWELLKEQGQ